MVPALGLRSTVYNSYATYILQHSAHVTHQCSILWLSFDRIFNFTEVTNGVYGTMRHLMMTSLVRNALRDLCNVSL